MDALTAARQIAEPVQVLGARFMLDGAAYARGPELGLPPGMGTYFLGRFGVLGDVDTDTVIEAAHFWNPDLIRANWTDSADIGAGAGGAAYGVICAERGSDYLDGFAGSGRLADLLATVADNADDAGAALFAGWRDLERPDDDAGRAYLLVQTIRELRFCRHVVAARADGADPAGMVLSHSGEDQVKLFGWGDTDVEPVAADRMDAIEKATDEASAADLSPFSDDERSELVELATAAHAHATA
jgi:hypothetical protein